MIGSRQEGPAAGLVHSRDDGLVVASHHDRAEPGRLGAPEHLHDHRQTGDIRQRLAGQPGRGHAGRDQDENVVRHCQLLASKPRCAPARRGGRSAALYGLPEPRKTGYCAPPQGALRCKQTPSRLSAKADLRWIPSNSTRFSVLFSALASFCFRSTSRQGRCSRRTTRKSRASRLRSRKMRVPVMRPSRLRPMTRCRCASPAPTSSAVRISAKKCAACHTFGKGEPNRVGPNLYRRHRPSQGIRGWFQLLRGDEGAEGRMGRPKRSTRI